MTEKNNSNKKFLVGAAIGAVAGAVAGVLFAPKSGKETRKIIGDKAKEITVDGKNMLKKGQSVAKGAIHDVASEVAGKTK